MNNVSLFLIFPNILRSFLITWNIMMLIFKILVCYLLAASSFLYGTLTLESCYDLALNYSETLTVAELKALIEQDRTREIYGLHLPQITAQIDFLTKGNLKRVRHQERTKNARVSLVIPLYNFGHSTHTINAQKSREESSFIKMTTARQKILHATNHAYFTLAEAQKIILIIKESIRSLKGQLRISKDFAEQGLIHENEILVVELELALRQQDLLQAQSNVSIAATQLNRLIGYPLDRQTVVIDLLEPIPYHANLNQLLEDAQSNHPHLKALQADIKAARSTLTAEKGKLYPSIYGYTNYSTSDNYALPYRHGLDAGIGIQLSLYDGGATWAKLRRLRKEMCELEQQYIAAEKDMELYIRTAFSTVENTIQKIPLALKAIQVAEHNLTLVKNHFAEGLITNEDLMIDEEKLLHARHNYYQTLCQYYKAKADLAYAAGLNFL